MAGEGVWLMDAPRHSVLLVLPPERSRQAEPVVPRAPVGGEQACVGDGGLQAAHTPP